jgi:ABC-2 type transport system permease protein
MNTESVVEVAPVPASRLMYWAVRRELWENRSIYLAPLAVAGLILVGFLISTVFLPGRMRAASADPVQQHQAMAQPYLIVAGLMMLTTLAVGVFYSLDALYGERRDRSILFWKSMPVSDLTTVLSKAITPVVILPLVTFAVTVLTQSVMLLVSTAVLLGSGLRVTTLWSHDASLFQSWPMLLQHLLVVHGLWYAPIYGWLLLVSAWARRAPFLWASLPPLAIGLVERIAFNTSHFGAMLADRVIGAPGDDHFMAASLSMNPLMHFSPGGFLGSPGLWIGLAVGAAFVAAAVRLRRYRDPI